MVARIKKSPKNLVKFPSEPKNERLIYFIRMKCFLPDQGIIPKRMIISCRDGLLNYFKIVINFHQPYYCDA